MKKEESIKKVAQKRKEVGLVVSNKMQKTVVVQITRRRRHPLYQKLIKERKRLKAHDELGAKIGDKVRIEESRPFSKEKRWRVVEILGS